VLKILVFSLGNRSCVALLSGVLLASALLVGCATPAAKLLYGSSAQHSDECVVLLHGLARSSKSMQKLESAFNQAGLRTLNIDYPSTKFVNAELLELFIQPRIEQHCSPKLYQLHFVSHSMGGILSRLYIQQNRPAKLGKVVTIASPHKGSELVDRLGWLPLFKWINGRAGYEMGANADTLIDSLPTPDYPVLAVVGTFSTNPFYSLLIPGGDDGKVSVQSARLGGAKEILAVPYSHTFIMQRARVVREVVRFVGGE